MPAWREECTSGGRADAAQDATGRPFVVGLALRPAAAVSGADHVVQDACLRVSRGGTDEVDNLRARRTTVVARWHETCGPRATLDAGSRLASTAGPLAMRFATPDRIRSPPRRSVSSLRRAGSLPCCARFEDGALDSFAQPDGYRCVEPPEGFDSDQLLFERPRERGRGRHPPQQRFGALRWKRSVGKGGQVTGGSAPHRSTTGRIASNVGARGWGLSLTRAMSRTGTGVAMPQLPLMSLNGGRVRVRPERVMICSL